ncbi:MAG: hypothetical protein N3E38_01855 [Candidatus Aenigmarchaeota archaeon]|nr:hypothetical protein [Candidatus Aenigmarchaeota archaeon]
MIIETAENVVITAISILLRLELNGENIAHFLSSRISKIRG